MKVKKIKKGKINKSLKPRKQIESSVQPQDSQGAEVKAAKGKLPQVLRGMRDILPREEKYWKGMYRKAEEIAEFYCYEYIETPKMEDAALFIRSIGRGTDVVEKEMYVFEDAEGGKICLRPEATASVARAYITHGMQTYPQPVKLWYYGPMFRHDRPQSGRYREFHQFGCENMGVRDPAIDAELISAAYNFLRDLGIDAIAHINSLGAVEDRQNYIIELSGYLRAKRGYLCEDCKRRIAKNPLRALDCKNEQCQPIIEDAPQIIDWLSSASKNYFMKVLEYLDELKIPYALKHTLVRGLDYYTETVFELYEENPVDAETRQGALGGGGRYDLLIAQMGGLPTPACGFSIGLERVAAILRRMEESAKVKNTEENRVLDKSVIFFAQLGEQARQKTLCLIEELRRAGIRVRHNLGKSALKAQLELANKQHAAYALILGQKEAQDGTVIIRDMESGIQEIVDQKKLKSAIEKKMEV